MYDSLLEARIRLQKAISTGNTLPKADKFDEYAEQLLSESTGADLYRSGICNLMSVLDSVSSFEEVDLAPSFCI